MEALIFLPLILTFGCLVLALTTRARSAERQAKGWEQVARDQGVAMENLSRALSESQGALKRTVEVMEMQGGTIRSFSRMAS
jgi:DNA-binding phage protein